MPAKTGVTLAGKAGMARRIVREWGWVMERWVAVGTFWGYAPGPPYGADYGWQSELLVASRPCQLVSPYEELRYRAGIPASTRDAARNGNASGAFRPRPLSDRVEPVYGRRVIRGEPSETGLTHRHLFPV